MRWLSMIPSAADIGSWLLFWLLTFVLAAALYPVWWFISR